MPHTNTIARIIALEHAAAAEAARTGDTLVNAQMLVRNSAALIDALKPSDAIDAVNAARRDLALSRGLNPSDYEHYSPTAADRDNDAKIDAWKARQIEATRLMLCDRIANDLRQRAADCVRAYAERVSA